MGAMLTVVCAPGGDQGDDRETLKSVVRQTFRDWEVRLLRPAGARDDGPGLGDPRIRRLSPAPGGQCESLSECLADIETEFTLILSAGDVFTPLGIGPAVGALSDSGAAFCMFNTAFKLDGAPASPEAVRSAGFVEDVTSLTRFEHLNRLLDPTLRLNPGAVLARTDLLRQSHTCAGLSTEVAETDRIIRMMLGGRGVFLPDILVETVLPDATVLGSPRRRAERLGCLRLYRSPAALEQVHRIFPVAAVREAPAPSGRLWYLGQQLLKRPEPEARVLGLECLRDALVEHGPTLAEQLAASMGVAPSAYVDRVAERLFSSGAQGPALASAEKAGAPLLLDGVDNALAGRTEAPARTLPATLKRERATVSVVFTCYSGELYFEDALRSVLAQTYSGIELVFHDNGCSESYRALIARSAERYGGRVIRSEINRYGEGLRYDVLPFLETDFVAILHDDDLYVPEKIERSLAEMAARKLDYIFTDRLYVDASGTPFPVDMEEVNNTPVLPEHFPNQMIADTYYAGLRLHFSTLVMATELAKKNLLGDPFLPRITDSLFMQRLLLDRDAKGAIVPEKDTLVRVHGANDMLYTKFDAEGRAREFALLQIGEYICFQELIQTAPTEQLGDILAIFPGVPRITGEDRVGMLVRAALDLRNWYGSKPLMAAFCIHQAFLIDGRKTMEKVREHSPEVGGGPATDCNGLTQTLYRKFIQTLGDQLFVPHDAHLREAWQREADDVLQAQLTPLYIERDAANQHAAALEGALADERRRFEAALAEADERARVTDEALAAVTAQSVERTAALERALSQSQEDAAAGRLAAESEMAARLADMARAHRLALDQAESRVGAAVDRTLAAVHQSSSWRLTRPVRWAASLAKPGRSGAAP